MLWNVFFVFLLSTWLVTSMENHYQPLKGSFVWGYFTSPVLQQVRDQPRKTAMEAMVDLTNNLGIAILQDHSFSRSNFAFSPYGVASVLVVLYEGARSESAKQIQIAVHFPEDKDLIRVGFRNIHRHLRNYFSHEGYLSGISLNKETSNLRPEYKKILRFYGYDIDLNQTLDKDDEYNFGNQTPEVSPPADLQGAQPTDASSHSSTSVSEVTTPIFVNDKGVTDPHESEKEETILSTVATSVTQPSTQPFEKETENLKDATVLSTVGAFVTQTTRQSSEKKTESLKDTTTLSTAESSIKELPQKQTEHSGTDETNKTNNLETTTFATTTIEPSENKMTLTTVPVDFDEFQINLTVENHLSCEEMVKAKKQKAEGCKTESTTGATNDAELNEVLAMQNEDQEGSMLSSTTTTQEPLFEDFTTEAKTKKNEEIEEITNTSLDNGMLIPQSDDRTSEAVTELQLSSAETTSSAGSTSSGETAFFVETSSPARTSPVVMKAVEEGYEKTTESEKKNSFPKNGTQVRVKNKIRMSTEKEEDEVSQKSIRSLINNKMPLWLRKPQKKFSPRKKRTITDYLKSPYNPDLSLQLQNGMYDTHISRNANFYRSLPRLLFLVDGAVDTPVPMMTYTNIFNYAYIPRLHSKALEFPLDDIRYKLLILLPVERRGLRQLIYDLANFPLCNVIESVRPTRVKAMVPTFMVEGFIILTSSLQKLGIWDVFDPRKANLSGMSMDPELYVRNVEQSVTVVIRNYVEILDIQTRTMAARVLEEEFEATHPFLYFVLDTETNVVLMAGQILDPLNSRIY